MNFDELAVYKYEKVPTTKRPATVIRTFDNLSF